MDYMHYQRYPHIHGDLEPAFVVRPHEPCCPDEQEECVCVTSGDVERWNDAADMLSALSGVTPEDIDKIDTVLDLTAYSARWNSAADAVETSAEFWNSTYDTVCANSAVWASAKDIPQIESDINDLTSALSALADTKSDKLYFDPNSISGDGSPGAPYAVRDWVTNKNLRDDVNDIYHHIIKIPSGTDGYKEERWLFDGEHEMLASARDAISAIQSDLNLKTDAINSLSSVALSASAFAKDVRDRCPTYEADEYTLHRSTKSGAIASGVGNTYVFSLKKLPYEYTSAIDLGAEAYNIAKRLDAMELVQFKYLAPYPTSTADITACTSGRTIYYCV